MHKLISILTSCYYKFVCTFTECYKVIAINLVSNVVTEENMQSYMGGGTSLTGIIELITVTFGTNFLSAWEVFIILNGNKLPLGIKLYLLYANVLTKEIKAVFSLCCAIILYNIFMACLEIHIRGLIMLLIMNICQAIFKLKC